MNLRRGLAWFHARLVSMAEAGKLRVRWQRSWIQAEDEADIDAWLTGTIPPALVRYREEAPGRFLAAGGEIG